MMLAKCARDGISLYRRIGMGVFPKRLLSISIVQSAKHDKKKSFHQKKPCENRIQYTYEQESNNYLLRELKKLDLIYKSRNKQVPEIVQQFSEVLKLYGLDIVSTPLPGIKHHPYDYIHLSKEVETLTVGILLDSRSEDINDAQAVITDETKPSQLLYLVGTFTREKGFSFYSAMILDTDKMGKDSAEVYRAICSAEGWIYRALNNSYEKQLEINHPEVIKFLSFQSGENDMPELDGRLLVDSLLNYTIGDLLCDNQQDSVKLNSIISMLVSYCRDSAYGKWIREFKSFVQS